MSFAKYYEVLYTSKIWYLGNDLAQYFNEIIFPELSDESRRNLDFLFSLEEITDAISDTVKGKSPGPIYIILKVYVKYLIQFSPSYNMASNMNK